MAISIFEQPDVVAWLATVPADIHRELLSLRTPTLLEARYRHVSRWDEVVRAEFVYALAVSRVDFAAPAFDKSHWGVDGPLQYFAALFYVVPDATALALLYRAAMRADEIPLLFASRKLLLRAPVPYSDLREFVVLFDDGFALDEMLSWLTDRDYVNEWEVGTRALAEKRAAMPVPLRVPDYE